MSPDPLPKRKTIDANESVASVAYRLSEIISIYPITPSTSMGELSDEWSAAGNKNLWGEVPQVVQMQSEAGVAGTYHGILMGGCLSSTFTASQGLLLMIPVMYKLAGELTPTVMHVSARAIATNALSIFGDHSDVMACRQTGFAILASNSVQEAQDMAAIAHAATLRSRLPFLHFFDGFRTSHELNSITPLNDEVLLSLIDETSLADFYDRAITPDKPTVRGTAQNPDTYFQAREAVNPYYKNAPTIVQEVMDDFAQKTGRTYNLFDYYGHPEAEEIIVMMGSGVETAANTAAYLNAQGRKCGVLAVRLYRPFYTHAFNHAFPKTVKKVAVLDRTKEPGSIGEPLYLDVTLALNKARRCPNQCRTIDPIVVGGRYGIGSKEFTPAMVQAVFNNLHAERPLDHFTVGIRDDVTHLSLFVDPRFTLPNPNIQSAVFFGLGSDGTVGANKNTIKIIGEATNLYTQAYFVYDSKKSGGLTTSHLRFGTQPIQAPYLVDKANFVACHQPQFIGRVEMLSCLADGGIFLLNSACSPQTTWDELPLEFQETLIAKKARLYTIDAYQVARDTGMGRRINTIMQVAFFALSNVIPTEQAIDQIKAAIEKTYGRKGPKIVEMNKAAVDATLAHLHEVSIPDTVTAKSAPPFKWVPNEAPDFVQRVTAQLLAGNGELLPVSSFPVDGVWPTGTSQYEKRRIASEIPFWNADICTQCNQCSLFCPHAAIRPKVYDKAALAEAPESFVSTLFKGPSHKDKAFTIQVFPEDCTGCNACVQLCPASDEKGRKALEMVATELNLEREKANLQFFQNLPTTKIEPATASAKTLSLREPLFEFSGACSGCTQTSYIRILTQLFGDRLLIANATGCSSIYGGNLPTTPYCQDTNGRGPAWANSLFEDNAEFGLGLHLAAKRRTKTAIELLKSLQAEIGDDLVESLLKENDGDQRREYIMTLKDRLKSITTPEAIRLKRNLDYLVEKTTWIIGGDGWAYDIGYGGLDHVLASGHNVNVLVLDTEVYSNTGGQSSKSTPLGALAKFAAAGKSSPKKDLGMIAMTYGNIFVGQIALGANQQQTINVFREAESYQGPSLILAYGPCLAHGIDLAQGPERQKAAVETGYWPLYHYDPRHLEQALPALSLDSFEPSVPVSTFMEEENRFRALQRGNPARAALLFEAAQNQVDERWKALERLASIGIEEEDDEGWG